MALFGKLQERIRYSILAKKARKRVRNVQTCNLDDAKSVGIIFNADNQDAYDKAFRFATSLTQRGVEVFALGYVDDKTILHYFSEKKNFKFFSRKAITWLGKPKSESIDTFVDKKFDVLIDLSLEVFYPVQYIMGSSLASLKAGRQSEHQEYYDIMINIDKEPTLENLINQLDLYLSILRTK